MKLFNIESTALQTLSASLKKNKSLLSFLLKLNPFKKSVILRQMDSMQNNKSCTDESSDYTKRVALIRHGQSEYNTFRQEALRTFHFSKALTYDLGVIDSPLTMLGKEQARALCEKQSKTEGLHHCQLVITSPLSRAIDTALEIFHSKIHSPSIRTNPSTCQFKIIISPLLTEWLDTSGDIGVSLNELKDKYKDYSTYIDWGIWETQNWPKEQWWYSSKELSLFNRVFRSIAPEPKNVVQQRVNAFKEYLYSRPEKHICIVGHSWYFHLLTGDTKMGNCEIRWYTVHPEYPFTRLK